MKETATQDPGEVVREMIISPLISRRVALPNSFGSETPPSNKFEGTTGRDPAIKPFHRKRQEHPDITDVGA
ncbi:MAG: hypothetical protein AB1744_07275, partial [Candidatus Zixiibacteriota bacterium]